MTMRSKQWYTKTSRLSNSFANNSIGRPPGFCVRTTSTVKDFLGQQPGMAGPNDVDNAVPSQDSCKQVWRFSNLIQAKFL